LNWATDKGYNKLLVYHSFKPTLKQTENEPLYLETEELNKLQLLEIPKQKQYLERVRDVFLFCCFSGLRHSDVFNLRRSDLKSEGIVITTIKTGDTLLIDYNSVLRRILDKYKDIPFPGGKALPVCTNQQMNRYLKELCKLAGIDAPYRRTTYKGSERIDEIKPKYEWISSHSGRKTFCVMHLSAGTSPDIVRKWTGHKTEKTMRPYKAITERARKEAMPVIEQFDILKEKDQ